MNQPKKYPAANLHLIFQALLDHFGMHTNEAHYDENNRLTRICDICGEDLFSDLHEILPEDKAGGGGR